MNKSGKENPAFSARKVKNQSDVLIASAIVVADMERRGRSATVSHSITHIGLVGNVYVIGSIGDKPTCVASYSSDGMLDFHSVEGFHRTDAECVEFTGLLKATEEFMRADGIHQIQIDRDELDMPEDNAVKNLGYEFVEDVIEVQYARKMLASPAVSS